MKFRGIDGLRLGKLVKYRRQIGLLFIALLLMVLFMITSPRVFLGPNIYLSFLTTVPFVGIMGLGITIVLVSGEIDLSFPAVMAFSGYVFATLYELTGSALLGFVASLATGAVAGLCNGLLITRIGIPSIVVTLGMQFLLRGSTHVLAAGFQKVLRGIAVSPVYTLFVSKVGDLIPAQSLWFAFLAVCLWFMLFRHKFGDHILFVGDNEDTASMMGINVNRTKVLVFMLMGILAAFAGLLDSMRMRTWWPTMGEGYLMTTFATVFVGGTSMFGGEGTILGTFIGAFLIGSLEAGIVGAGLTGFWTQLIYGLIILIAVTLHAEFRRRERL
jgi:simple sugar transport system permease protein